MHVGDMTTIRTSRVLLCCALFASFQCLQAQIKPSRSVFNEPLDKLLPPGAVADAWFAAEAFRGGGSYEGDQDWQFRLHGYIEPYRFGDDSLATVTTSLQFHHELTANPYNDLGFNPRTARWEEQLLVHVRLAPFTIQAGWFHRCKHEIDNSERPDDVADPTYEPTRRALIVSGPMVTGVSPSITTPIGTIRAQLGGEWYVVNEDYRTPDSVTTGSWNGLQASVWARGQIGWTLSSSIEAGGSYYISFPFFTNRYGAPDDIIVPHEARAELFLSLVSSRAFFSIIAAADHTWDEVASLAAQPTTVLQLGLRVGGR